MVGISRRHWLSVLCALPVASAVAMSIAAPPAAAQGDGWVWIEGEAPAQSDVTRHPWWYEQVKTTELSGGAMLAHFDDNKAGAATYVFTAPGPGPHEVWLRGNVVRNRVSYRLNGGAWTVIDAQPVDGGNIAADGRIDLRFIAWVKLGRLPLNEGTNRLEFRIEKTDAPQHHGMIDAVVVSRDRFTPRGLSKPGGVAAAGEGQWVDFDPPDDGFDPRSRLDLRPLNEARAGSMGRIVARDGRFVHETSGTPVRFWAVNGPNRELTTLPEQARATARLLAKRGVNLVRWHGAVFNGDSGAVDQAAVEQMSMLIDTFAEEGIYTHISIYFPLWMTPDAPGAADSAPWAQGFDGRSHPFAVIFFNEGFERQYQDWWKAVMQYRSPRTGRTIADEPAVMGVELVNEDSLFFWTFGYERVPTAQMRLLERRLGTWLTERYGSIEAGLRTWGLRHERDAVGEGRLGIRNLWDIANRRTRRDQDTAAFLAQVQRAFYERNTAYLRSLGYEGMVTASNWTTASSVYLNPLERYTYSVGDFIDRHGYVGCAHEGEHAGWSIREGHLYRDLSHLRFETAGGTFNSPIVEPEWFGKPSMISETTFNRPNRYRTEAPLMYAAYGALFDTDAIVHFALDGSSWHPKPRFFMQPWTLLSPTQVGQFPATALIYRKGLVDAAPVVRRETVTLDGLMRLSGISLAQEASLDELRKADLPADTDGATDSAPSTPAGHPALPWIGRWAVDLGERAGVSEIQSPGGIAGSTVTSATRQVRLDWGKGLLTVDAPQAAGLCGDLSAARNSRVGALTIDSPMTLGQVIAVSLDDRPLAESSKILLQVMSEERPAGWQTAPAGEGRQRIVSLGTGPWQIRRLSGTVTFHCAGAATLRTTPLDANGMPTNDAPTIGATITLQPGVIYYLVETGG